MFKFRDYQLEIIEKGIKILSKNRILYLAMEVRTGKTFTALGVAEKMGVKNVLFITKKKAISSIEKDYNTLKPSFSLVCINYESVHKIDTNPIDLVVIDEAHSLGTFPKPSLRTKRIKEIVGKKYCMLLSGTPTPESYSQIYHQFWVSAFTPFTETSFYKWAKVYVNIIKKKINGYDINDYSRADEPLIKQKVNKYFITFTQQQAGFTSQVNEHILEVEMASVTKQLIKILERDQVYESKNGSIILADTAVKCMQKVHQLCSGTVKLEDGKGVIIDYSKGLFIANKFKGKKIGIFYKFAQELELLKKVFKDNLTTDLREFNATGKNIALQIVSGREGINLSKADYLVFYNIDFSATSYWQSRDRLTTKERKTNDIYWIFSKNGIEKEIYKKVLEKKNFTSKYYERGKLSKQIN